MLTVVLCKKYDGVENDFKRCEVSEGSYEKFFEDNVAGTLEELYYDKYYKIKVYKDNAIVFTMCYSTTHCCGVIELHGFNFYGGEDEECNEFIKTVTKQFSDTEYMILFNDVSSAYCSFSARFAKLALSTDEYVLIKSFINPNTNNLLNVYISK